MATQKLVFGLAIALGVTVASGAMAQSGVFTNGLPAASDALTKAERLPADTALSGGRSPQSEYITVNQLRLLTPITITDPSQNAANGGLVYDVSTGDLFTVTITGNGKVLQNPSNLVTGQTWRIIVTNSNYAGISSAGTLYKWSSPFVNGIPSGLVPTLPMSPSDMSHMHGSINMMSFIYDGTNILGWINGTFR